MGAAVSFGAGAGYGTLIERHAIDVSGVSLHLGLERPLRLAFVSDVHFDPLYETDYLAGVCDEINRLSPDILCYGGDFLTRSADRLTGLMQLLGRARGVAGTFAVLGNHDHWIDADRIEAALSSIGVDVLRNRSVALPDNPGFRLTGIESFWGGAPDTAPLSDAPPDSRHILLVHEPDPFDRLTDSRIALQLSGHTHGGQVRIPALGAISLPRLGRRYQAGLYDNGGRRLYVNRGLGTVKHHVRLNCRPEITLFTLT